VAYGHERSGFGSIRWTDDRGLPEWADPGNLAGRLGAPFPVAGWRFRTAGSGRPRRTKKIDTVRTFSPKQGDITRAWHVIDADGLVLGRLATEVARLLRGKHKPIFAPHVDTGDHVIVVNAKKVVLTANKAKDKQAYRHSGYPGSLRSTSYEELLATKPEELVRRAVRGMLPKGTLGRQQLLKLKIYAGPDHPHAAQTPTPLAVEHARRVS
jgi:large subunit ribosomal protein L13